MKTKNIFALTEAHLQSENEIFENILTGRNLKIERIISAGQTTPAGEWYDQETDEWVVLLQGEAELEFENGEKTPLQSGDYIFLPAHYKHRVSKTSQKPPCIWLAIHGKLC